MFYAVQCPWLSGLVIGSCQGKRFCIFAYLHSVLFGPWFLLKLSPPKVKPSPLDLPFTESFSGLSSCKDFSKGNNRHTFGAGDRASHFQSYLGFITSRIHRQGIDLPKGFFLFQLFLRLKASEMLSSKTKVFIFLSLIPWLFFITNIKFTIF